jgi:hypothetical protein
MLGLPLNAAPPSRQQPKRPAQLADDGEAAQDEALYNSLYSSMVRTRPGKTKPGKIYAKA